MDGYQWLRHVGRWLHGDSLGGSLLHRGGSNGVRADQDQWHYLRGRPRHGQWIMLSCVLQGEPDQRVVLVEFSQLQVVGGGCSRGGGIGPGVGHADHPRCRVSTESELGFEPGTG